MMGLIYLAFIAMNKDDNSKGGGGPGGTTSTEDSLEEARRIMEKYKWVRQEFFALSPLPDVIMVQSWVVSSVVIVSKGRRSNNFLSSTHQFSSSYGLLILRLFLLGVHPNDFLCFTAYALLEIWGFFSFLFVFFKWLFLFPAYWKRSCTPTHFDCMPAYQCAVGFSTGEMWLWNQYVSHKVGICRMANE